jgi:hypothetical protein
VKEFTEEEAIFNTQAPHQATQRTKKHAKQLDRRIRSIFIAKRCEVEGCDKRDEDVKGCSRCGCVFYCCREHRLQDWPRHKLECKKLANYTQLLRKDFSTPEELKRYPIGCYPFESTNKEVGVVCGAKADETKLGYTPCCNVPICDNEREHCMHSHMHYTKCFQHFEEEHEGFDWRECERCNALENGVRPVSTTNAFNLTPALEKNLPQGSFITKPCENPCCKQRILPGHDSSTYKLLSTGAYANVCSDCSATTC